MCCTEPWRNGAIDMRVHRKIPISFDNKLVEGPCSTFAEFELRSPGTASLDDPQRCSAQSVNGWCLVVNDMRLNDSRSVRRLQIISDPRGYRRRVVVCCTSLSSAMGLFGDR